MAENQVVEINGGDVDEDEALRIAIALSLGEDPTKPNKAHGDAFDPDQDDTASDSSELFVTSAPEPAPPPPPAPSSSSFSALGLDRKKMEQERLARLSKRKASELGPSAASDSDSRLTQRQKTGGSGVSLPGANAGANAGAAAISSKLPLRETSASKPTHLESPVASGPTSVPIEGGLPFPRGVVKRTWAYGQPRLGDDIKIEEVLQKNKLRLAVLSSYQWDYEWVQLKIDIALTKIVFIAFAANEEQKKEMLASIPQKTIRYCFPKMLAMGSMHSKLQLLKYDNYMRIVVPTGNLVAYDWGETGAMENMVFIIDLPKFESLEQSEAQELPAFGEDLIYFLRAQGLNEKLLDSLRKYDFSETSRYGFVHSIVGSHSLGDAWKRTGYCGLGRSVSALGLASDGIIEMDIVSASLGAVNASLLRALYYACQGDSGMKEYKSRAASRKAKGDTGTDDDLDTLKSHVRVYFPSQETVAQSRGGKNAAGTICFASRWWDAPTFPHEVLMDYRATRKGMLVHSKAIFVRLQGAETAKLGFAYIGSANLSESAWGRLVKDRATSSPKITCRNWECGVLVPADDGGNPGTGYLTSSTSSAAPLNKIVLKGGAPSQAGSLRIFDGRVPIPVELPGTPFSKSPRTPWFYQEG
ncbi:tyrosyl-DNA phosphodiesterase-domain-containing protein [Lasiosphaeria hispida]|uniref:Tyrosyl-DNA phosphodiesterase-domain-containing protein n=1 Tax=Lasiosphaeria hispida TaxID=260671 RepID=A0AAJ0HM67_9PEZI|nr:tyrosyl-DNA phosphodiesterase-domain-containing protein [Lasiosphaeria hispida]